MRGAVVDVLVARALELVAHCTFPESWAGAGNAADTIGASSSVLARIARAFVNVGAAKRAAVAFCAVAAEDGAASVGLDALAVGTRICRVSARQVGGAKFSRPVAVATADRGADGVGAVGTIEARVQAGRALVDIDGAIGAGVAGRAAARVRGAGVRWLKARAVRTRRRSVSAWQVDLAAPAAPCPGAVAPKGIGGDTRARRRVVAEAFVEARHGQAFVDVNLAIHAREPCHARTPVFSLRDAAVDTGLFAGAIVLARHAEAFVVNGNAVDASRI